MLNTDLKSILSLFGTETARNNFINLCKEYYGERLRQEALNEVNIAAFNSKRAEIHNQIMDVVQKLYIPTNKVMPSRKEVGNWIMEFFSSEQDN